MILSRAIPADAARLTAIAFAAKRHWGYPEQWLQQWAEQITLTPDYVAANATFAAREEGQHDIVAFSAVQLDGPIAWLDHLWVLPAAMGRGVGRALFAAAEEHARAVGATQLAIIGDPHAAGFYERMGAMIVGWEPAPMAEAPDRKLPRLEKALR